MAFFGADMPDANYEGLKAAVAHMPASDPSAAEMRGLVSSHRDWIGMDRARLGSAHQWRQLFREWDANGKPSYESLAAQRNRSSA